MPRAIVGGLLLVIAVYMLVNISYMAVLGVAGILESQAVALVCNYVQLCLELFLVTTAKSYQKPWSFMDSESYLSDLDI